MQSFLEKHATTDSFTTSHDLHEQLLDSVIRQNADEAWELAQKIAHY